MASTATSPMTCTVCAKPATTHCGGCTSEEVTKLLGRYTPTLYCGTVCQQSDWDSHKKLCKLKQAQTKLFRTGEILQEVFLATREEALETRIIKVERREDGRLHVFAAVLKAISNCRPHRFSTALPEGGPEVKHAVLSLGGGPDALSGMLYEIAKELFKDNSFKVEELPLNLLEAKMKVSLYFGSKYAAKPPHIVLRVTLADGSTWAVDPAGAQYGQCRPVMRFSDYQRDYVGGFPLPSMPHGGTAASIQSYRSLSLTLMEIENYQIDQLHEWVFENVAIKQLLKVKQAEFVELKQSLVAYLAAAARDHVNLTNGDLTSPAKTTLVKYQSNPGLLSAHDRGRLERRKARKIADMDFQHPGLAADSDIWSNVTFM